VDISAKLTIKKLWGHETFRHYFANTSWLMGDQFFRMGISFVVGVYVARYLGPERLGILNYAISFTGLFKEIATLGLDRIAVRELVLKENKKEQLMGTIFWLKLSGAILAFSLIAITISFMNDDALSKLIVIIVACSLLFQTFMVIDFYFQSKVLSKYAAIAQSTQAIISALIKVFLVLIQAPVLYFAMVLLLDNAILAIGLLFFYTRTKGNNFRFFTFRNFDWFLAKDLMKDAWPLILSGLAVLIYMRIDQVMLKQMIDSQAVGQYAVAVRLSETWYFIPALILQSVFPAIVLLKKENAATYQVRLQQLHDILSLMAFTIAIITTFFAKDIVGFLFGPKFLEAASILTVHIWAGIFVFPGNIRANLIIVEHKQMVALVFRVIGAILNVGLNLLLIPRYGPVGAAWATLASYTVPVCLISFFDPLIKTTMIMTFKAYFLPIRLLLYRKAIYEVARI